MRNSNMPLLSRFNHAPPTSVNRDALFAEDKRFRFIDNFQVDLFVANKREHFPIIAYHIPPDGKFIAKSVKLAFKRCSLLIVEIPYCGFVQHTLPSL